MFCKKEILLSVCCVLSIGRVLGKADLTTHFKFKGDDELPVIFSHLNLNVESPEVDTNRNEQTRSNLVRRKRGWPFDEDPSNRANEIWTTTTISPTPEETFLPPRPFETPITTPKTEPPPPGSTTTKVTTVYTSTPTTVQSTSTRRIYTSKMTMSTTMIPSTTSGEIFLPVCSVLCVGRVLGNADFKFIGDDERPVIFSHSNQYVESLEVDTNRNEQSRSNLVRRKRGLVFDEDPSNRARETWTTIPPTPETPITTPQTTTEPPPPGSSTTKVTTVYTTTLKTVKSASTRRVYTPKMTTSTTMIRSTTSASPKARGHLLPVCVVALVWTILTSTNYLEI